MPRLAHLKLVLAVGVAVTAAAIGAATAGARDVDTYSSKVVIDNDAPFLNGKVKSSHGPCKNKRHVAVFKRLPGEDEKIGGDETGPAGRWEVRLKIIEDDPYYARVRKRQQIVSGNGFVCEQDRSESVTFKPRR